MSVSIEEVRKIADLSKLNYGPEELERFVERFQQILDYFGQLSTAPIEDVHTTCHALELTATPFRLDQVRPSLGVELAVANAPQEVDGQFRVPKVIE